MARRPMSQGGRAGRLLRGFLAFLLVASIVHLGTVLVLSRREKGEAYAKLEALAHGMTLRTVAVPGVADHLFPFQDPATAAAFCLFDLRQGPVEVRLPVTPLDVATLSIYNARGQVLYALTNRSAVRGVLALTVATPATIAAADQPDDAVRVPLDGTEGFAMAEALAAMPSLRPTAEAAAEQLRCRAVPRG